MAASWEQRNQARVLVGILHVETTTVAWAFGLRNLQVPGAVTGATGMPFSHARNSLCMAALDHGFTHIFFLDSDVIPPNDAILRLLVHKVPVISGVYHRRSPPEGVAVAMKGGRWVQNYPPNVVMDVDVVGAGALLIHRDVLQALPPSRPGSHWFDWRVDLKGAGVFPDNECMSEDFTFCWNVRKHLGIPILLDTGVQCKHVGFSEVTHGKMSPLQSNPVT